MFNASGAFNQAKANMRKSIIVISAAAMAVTAPASAVQRDQDWLLIGGANPDLTLFAYLGGLAAVIAVVIAVSDGSDANEPFSP